MSLTRFSNRLTFSRVPMAAITLFIMGFTGLALKATASPSDKKTIVTFDAPVELPGKALPAGTYVFKLLDNAAARDIVQVFDKDEKQLLATILAVPDYRDPPPNKPIVNFEERASNAPPAVKALYFPGDTYGLEFVYPHGRAVQLAKRTNQNVLSMSNEMTKNMADQDKSANSASNQGLENTQITGVDPSGSPVEIVVIVGSEPK